MRAFSSGAPFWEMGTLTMSYMTCSFPFAIKSITNPKETLLLEHFCASLCHSTWCTLSISQKVCDYTAQTSSALESDPNGALSKKQSRLFVFEYKRFGDEVFSYKRGAQCIDVM